MKQDAESATPPVEIGSGAMAVSPLNTSALHHSNAPPAIPDHELLKKIGGGSYGEVWLARNVIGTHHAVKVIYRNAFDNERPFDREFEGIKNAEPISRSVQGLMHILQVGRNDEAGYFYYVMELADAAKPCGEDGRWKMEDSKGSERASRHPPSSILDPQNYEPRTLDSELKRRGALPVEECVQLGLTLTSALHALHEKGLVHRDIKPSNIIFVNGGPKLADIGLMADASAAQSFVGTAGFIPPEGPGSPQADLYSLGKVLYEISTGKDRQDFPELPVEMIQAGVAAGILPASEPGLPARREERVAAKRDTTLLNRVTWPLQFFRAAGSRPHWQARMPAATSLLELNSIIVKACETDFRKRYQTTQQMHDELALLQEGHSIKRRRATEQRLALCKKLVVLLALLLLPIATTGVFFTRIFRHTAREVSLTAQQKQEVERLHNEARALLNKQTKETFAQGISLLNQATVIDPNYTPAYVRLAHAYNTMSGWLLPPNLAMTEAKRNTMRALELDTKSTDARFCLVMIKLFYEWDWNGAEKECNQIAELNRMASHRPRAHYFWAVGRLGDSRKELFQMLEGGRPSVELLSDLVSQCLFEHRYEEALSFAHTLLTNEPNHVVAQICMAKASVEAGEYSQALDAILKARRIDDGVDFVAEHGYILAKMGQRDEALKSIEYLDRLAAQTYVSPWFKAYIYAGLREDDQALTLLEKAYEERSGWLVHFRFAPGFDSLRRDPRFIAVYTKMGLEDQEISSAAAPQSSSRAR